MQKYDFKRYNFCQTTVRKSTHKCIATYVKLTKKLEFVLLHLIHTGIDNPNVTLYPYLLDPHTSTFHVGRTSSIIFKTYSRW